MMGTTAPVVVIVVKFSLASLPALLFSINAGATGLADACQKLAAAPTEILVVFEDRPVSRNDTRSGEELRRMAGTSAAANHNVLGLTHAEPLVSLALGTRYLSGVDGRSCAAPTLELKLGFAILEVSLARELTDPCRRRIVEEHEAEHVAVWRTHLRAGARLLTPLLRRELGQPIEIGSAKEAQAQLRQRADTLVAAQLQRLKDGIALAHAEIDSAGTRQTTENRLRTCP